MIGATGAAGPPLERGPRVGYVGAVPASPDLEVPVHEPLELLARYGARVASLRIDGREVSRESRGGGLADGVEKLGTGLLAGLLGSSPEIESVALVDDDVSLRLERDGATGRLVVEWEDGPSFTQRIDLAPHPALEPPGRRPGFVPAAGGRLDDPVPAVHDPAARVVAAHTGGGLAFFREGRFEQGPGSLPVAGWLDPSPPLGPAWFREGFGLAGNLGAGAMAGAISSVDLVVAMAEAGFMAFFGAGGLPVPAVRDAIQEIHRRSGSSERAGFNLLHNPSEPAAEEATVDLYLEHGCRLVSASAYMRLSPAVVRYRYSGIDRDPGGRVRCPNRLFAKVSRPEVAEQFLRPASGRLLDELVRSGRLGREEAALAARWPMADAVTCEADSGGHTDHRPMPVLLPIVRRLRDRVARELGYEERGIRVALGAAGGLGSPEAILAAFTLGADYVLTGSVNQCTLEAGTSELAKEMLLDAGMADVDDGAAPDMFEMGAKVQVLSRGTMYPTRSRRLRELYRAWPDWESVPAAERRKVEKQVLRRSFEEVWADTERYWAERDPARLERARADAHQRMALVFRWYLGMASRWARVGEPSRRRDFQVWCGPAMGAFNDWVRGTALEPLSARSVVAVNRALLRGATALHRARQLESQGVALPPSAHVARPG